MSTTSEEKDQLSKQAARMFYKNRLPFHVAEDPEFIKFCEMMRPGLGGKLLSRRDLSGKALTNEHDTIEQEMRSSLKGKDVVLSQDGWSNLHNEAIIASCLHIPGKTFFHDAKEAKDATKDAEFCTQLAKDAILSAEEKYGCKVVGFVSDSEAKMVKVRENLKVWRGKEFIVYGCSAHYVNLIQTNATPSTVKAHLVEIQKFFSESSEASCPVKGTWRENSATSQRNQVVESTGFPGNFQSQL